jgi:23S rRNA maturation-related 3'-5' exoribonuclease YhaM
MNKKELDYNLNELYLRIDSLHDEKHIVPVKDYILKYMDSFRICPGSIKHHHSYTGGLVKHTIEVIDIALDIWKSIKQHAVSQKVTYNDVLLVSVLHDIGKINEYNIEERDVFTERLIWKYVSKWPVFPHSTWVVIDFLRECPNILEEKHIEAILSHHGGWSKTGVECNSLLATILHSADLISSRLVT